jgi:hypothetical protein
MQLKAEKSKIEVKKSFFEEVTLSDEGTCKEACFRYTKAMPYNKKAFFTSDDPQWWETLKNKTSELRYLAQAEQWPYFSDALRDLGGHIGEYLDLDYEILKRLRPPDPQYIVDYLLNMEYAVEQGISETYINDLDALIDYLNSLLPRFEAKMKEAQEEFIDWEAIISSAMEVLALAKRHNMKGFMEELDYLNSVVLGHVQMPDDVSDDEIDSDFRNL